MRKRQPDVRVLPFGAPDEVAVARDRVRTVLRHLRRWDAQFTGGRSTSRMS
jgi:hypothetical protein